MKERPILFSHAMVRAIFEGRKTQTRRIVNPQPVDVGGIIDYRVNFPPHQYIYQWPRGQAPSAAFLHERCPYGVPGDRLWVRERYWVDKTTGDFKWYFEPGLIDPDREADHCKLRPSIHMPRAVSRITLEVLSVRVELVQQISDADARAEGVAGCDRGKETAFECSSFTHYLELWESIHGRESWIANPWVWAINFRKIGT